MKTDMNPEAVTARLKKTSELRRLCISLGGDRLRKKLGNTETLPDRMQQPPDRKKLRQD
ncbi:MAG: hypothetical protein Q3M24_10240 [Candidatus Electrothrix aestuarii]|uniref:Uncharacterized protein n=1 Tax=Candidatus Electrothrix aestuarii TaxID=3062594 RepID=A0AAU8M1T4_9BACT|nr:hypothetical protein [Candidatus Electrothrix aestuarii]